MPDVIIDVPLGTTATQLQTMINAADPGTTFRLQAGTYTFDKTVVINEDFVSLIGAGSDQTTIIAAKALGTKAPIQVGHTLYNPVIEDSVKVAATAHVGDTSVQVEAGHSIAVGDVIYIKAENTDEFLTSIGDTSWQKSNPLRTIMVEVTAVNGNQISFDSPLTFDYDPAISSVETRHVLHGNTLAGFSVEGAYGIPDPSNFNNVVGAGKGAVTIMIGGTSGMTINDIEIRNAVSSGILISDSIGVNLTGFDMNGSHNKGVDGNGYALWLREVYDSSFTDLSIVNTRHSVVFASYTTESGNFVQVTYTNRDINFHGGQDQFNVVVVDSSIRNAEEQKYMSTASFFNPGTFYGAPTDASKNSITFKQVVASNKDDTIYSHVGGSTVFTVDGNDTVYSAAGDDVIDGGNGTDLIYASGGSDAIQGGAGNDRIVFANVLATYTLTRDGDTLIVTGASGETRITSVESLAFGNGTYTLAALLASVGGGNPPDPVDPPPPPPPTGPVNWTEIDSTGMAVVNGTTSWDRHTSATSFVMGSNLDGSSFSGSAGLTVVGNLLDNNMSGNGGSNRMEGRGGNDKIYGGAGDDTLLGGDGNDLLEGSVGNDALTGGAGNDRLNGGDGNDQFLAAAGADTMDGGSGTDVLTFAGDLASYVVAQTSGGFTITSGANVATVQNVETFGFNGTSHSASALMQAWLLATGGGDPVDPVDPVVGTGAIWDEMDATGLLFVNGATGYQRYTSTVSFAMGNDLEASGFKGNGNLTAIGNMLGNAMKGNDGANRLEGRGGADSLKGGDGDDTLVGGSGDDRLDGGKGNDIVSGGGGVDELKGGKGRDSFVFLDGFGQDTITDFESAYDTLILGLSGIDSAAEVAALATQIKRDVLLNFGNGTTLLIEDVTVATLLDHTQFV